MPKPTATATPEQTAMPDPTATPEGNADLLTVGNYKIRLGMTFAEVNQEMGNSRIDNGCSPQGNDSYLYNPGGEYSSLIEVQFRNDTVVEMSTISGDFDYEGTVKAKDSISDLTNNGFTEMGTFKYTIYNKTGDKEHINVMVDLQRDDSKVVYGIQIFDRSLGELKKLLLPENCSYTGDVNTYQGRLEAHYLNAYRSYHKCKLMTITNEGVAQKQSEYMAEKKTNTKSDARNWDWIKRFEVDYGGGDQDEYDEGILYERYEAAHEGDSDNPYTPYEDMLHYRSEYTSVGSPDAFSAVTYTIAEQGKTTNFYQYILMNEEEMNIECGFADGYVAFDFYTFFD